MDRAGVTIRRRSVGLSAAILLVTACATSPPQPQDTARREAVLETALGQIGRPYRYGGGDGDGFDCSGLVQYVFDQAGVQVPRTAARQHEGGHRITLADAAPGDLVFFRIDGGLHVAVYIGNGRFVHAPATGQDVMISAIDAPFWQDHFVDAVRILR
jgi:murein DD-endopeptidase